MYLSTLDSLVGVLRWCFRNPRYCSTGDSFYLPSTGRYKVSVVSHAPYSQSRFMALLWGCERGFIFAVLRPSYKTGLLWLLWLRFAVLQIQLG